MRRSREEVRQVAPGHVVVEEAAEEQVVVDARDGGEAGPPADPLVQRGQPLHVVDQVLDGAEDVG